jgi:iron complex transport system substrate-binding protein
VALLAVLTALLAGCHSTSSSPPIAPAPTSSGAADFPREMVDARSTSLTLPAVPLRIVSLMPSVTEILYALGLQSRIVLDTTACDYPPDAKKKPHIDMFNGSVESILAQHPDLVIGVDHLNDRMIAASQKARVPTLVVGADTLQDVLISFGMIGHAAGVDAEAAKQVTQLKTALFNVRTAVGNAKSRPKVLMMYGANPIYTTGPKSFINDLIGFAGGVNAIGTGESAQGDVISSERVLALRPDVIICSPDVAAQARRLPGWAEGVPAVRNNRFYTAETALVRPGPRMAEATEKLARYMHPESYTLPGMPPARRH